MMTTTTIIKCLNTWSYPVTYCSKERSISNDLGSGSRIMDKVRMRRGSIEVLHVSSWREPFKKQWKEKPR